MKRLFFTLLLFLAPVLAAGQSPTVLLDGRTTTGGCVAYAPSATNRTFQAFGATSAGAGAATIKIKVSDVQPPGANDWVDMCEIPLTLGTTRTSGGCGSVLAWINVCADVTAISGTDAAVSVHFYGR